MPGPDVLLRHIGYAEDWLRRARYDWRRGDGPGALRRLMLAEAEIRHARETGAARAAPQAGSPQPAAARRLVAGLAAAAVLAAGIGYASRWTGTTQRSTVAVRGGVERPERGFGRSIVQLDSGRFLMPDNPAQDDSSGAAGGFTMRQPRADGAPAGRPPRISGVPVDLRTSPPTF